MLTLACTCHIHIPPVAVFTLALMPLDYTRIDHERLLQSIYRHLTGDTLACPTYGGHWEVVGFQGMVAAHTHAAMDT